MLSFLFLFVMTSCSLVSSYLTAGQGDNTYIGQQEILVPVVRGPISDTISFVGNLQYKQSSVMTWKTDGVIAKVYVKAGDRVKRNEILAELAADSLSSSVILSEKNMIESQERLEDVKASESARMQAYLTLNEKENALNKAKLEQEALYYPRATRDEMERAWDAYALANLNFNYAKQDYDYLLSINTNWEGYEPEIWDGLVRISGGDSRSARERKFEDYVNTYNKLVSTYETYVWTSGRPTDTEYAIAQGNVAVAQLEYDRALDDYLSYNKMPREKDVQAAALSLDSAEAVYKTRYILAPFDGIVTSVSAVDDYYVKKGEEAFRVDDLSSIYLPLNIPELDVGLLKVGVPVNIVVDAIRNKTYQGHIVSISESSESSDDATSFSSMVLIDDPDEDLRAGLTAEVSLLVNEKDGVLLIPSSAVTYEEGAQMVTLAEDNDRRKIKISTGIVSSGVTEVFSGDINEGDLISISSVTADVLNELGLDASQYPGATGRGMVLKP